MSEMRGNSQIPRSGSWWVLQGTGWLLLAYLTYAQLIPAFNYERGVQMGTQESAGQITEVGVAFFKGFAFGDLVTYAPLLFAGLVGHFLRRQWGQIAFAAALGITVYWPVVCLAAVVSAQDAEGWMLGSPIAYWIVLPIITLWGVWGLRALLKEGQLATKGGQNGFES
ncbi:hypothetical protein [Yoonia sp.]|uniref:hypothetical protein n=1 Tax=Yoonia sp. TaxID=2212373 RepID=UPI0035C812FC